MGWPAVAQRIMAAMEASGVSVDRKVIAPGPNHGRRRRQFTVYPESPTLATPGFGVPRGDCDFVPLIQCRAVFTADCAPSPGDDGSQPDADATTAWTLTFLADAQNVWNAIADDFTQDCAGVRIGPGVFTGPFGGVASMSVPIAVMPED